MIDLLEIRNSNRSLIGVIDTAKSIIWTQYYYGVGDFEIYIQFSPNLLDLLRAGNFVTRSNDRNIGIIERVNVVYNPQDGQMITASGRFAKSILSRRLIYNLSGKTIYPVISSGTVEPAVRKLVTNNIISAADSVRNISFIELGALCGATQTIIDDDGDSARKQTSFGNLLTYTDEVLQEYSLGAYMAFDRETLKLQYTVYEGVDRSSGNTAGNIPLVFSQEFDNLLSSEYSYDTTTLKNVALIGGEGEGVERFFALLTTGASGMSRREVFVDASSQSKTYKDEDGNEYTYSDAEYKALLLSTGRQELAVQIIVESFAGAVDITNSGLEHGVDFTVGDLVTMQDNLLGIYKTTRVTKVTEVQDDAGYTINIEFGE